MTSQLQTPLDDFAPPVNALLAGAVLSDPLRVFDQDGDMTMTIETGNTFSVPLRWRLTGGLVPFISGTWTVELFSDDIDGIGTKVGQIAATTVVAAGLTDPAIFTTTFVVTTAAGDAGLYRLAATISFTPTGFAPGTTSDLFGFVESVPIRIQDTPIDTD